MVMLLAKTILMGIVRGASANRSQKNNETAWQFHRSDSKIHSK